MAFSASAASSPESVPAANHRRSSLCSHPGQESVTNRSSFSAPSPRSSLGEEGALRAPLLTPQAGLDSQHPILLVTVGRLRFRLPATFLDEPRERLPAAERAGFHRPRGESQLLGDVLVGELGDEDQLEELPALVGKSREG